MLVSTEKLLLRQSKVKTGVVLDAMGFIKIFLHLDTG